jgi:hypothetical protein
MEGIAGRTVTVAGVDISTAGKGFWVDDAAPGTHIYWGAGVLVVEIPGKAATSNPCTETLGEC